MLRSLTLMLCRASGLHAWIVVALALLLPMAQAQQAKVELVERGQPVGTQFGPDDDHVLFDNKDGYYSLWNWRERHKNPEGPRFLINRRYAKDPTAKVLGKGTIRFNRAGQFMASCRDRKDSDTYPGDLLLAQVWDLRTGATAAELPLASPLDTCLALNFSPDGKTLAIATSTVKGNYAVTFFSTATWQVMRRTEFGPEIRLYDVLAFSPSGEQIVVWAHNKSNARGLSYRDHYQQYEKQVGEGFNDTRIEAIVLSASDGQILARKILHWMPTQPFWVEHTNGFDAGGERIVSVVPVGHGIEYLQKDIYLNCPAYQSPSIPDGFQPLDLCRKHKAVQIWHWRTGKVETLFELPLYVLSRSGIAVESPEQRLWTRIRWVQFTADGRFLVLRRESESKSDYEPGSLEFFSISALEIRDAHTYEVLVTKELGGKGTSVTGPYVSPDSRYLAVNRFLDRAHGGTWTRHLYELISK